MSWRRRAWWTVASLVLAASLGSCDPIGPIEDAALGDVLAIPLKYAGHVELTFLGVPTTRVERGATAFAVTSGSLVSAPVRQRVALEFTTIVPCSVVRSAEYSIRSDAGDVVATLTAPSCGAFGASSRHDVSSARWTSKTSTARGHRFRARRRSRRDTTCSERPGWSWASRSSVGILVIRATSGRIPRRREGGKIAPACGTNDFASRRTATSSRFQTPPHAWTLRRGTKR